MGAREDYPTPSWPIENQPDYDRMCAEIDDLRRWKAEAMAVLSDWQQCYDTLAEAGHPAPLGVSMARHVAGYLKVTT